MNTRAGSLALLLVMVASVGLAATRMPSLFRGVVVVDARPGARVVTVDEESAAYVSGLRPEDTITGVESAPVETIDDFASQSQRLAGHVPEASLTVLRAGQSVRLLVSLYSPRLIASWGERFVPNMDLRFRDANAGFGYWWSEAQRAARAQHTTQAIEAAETALHYQPERLETVLLLTAQWNALAQSRFAERRFDQGVAALQHAVNLYQRLLHRGVSEEHLGEIKRQLEQLVQALGRQLPAPASPTAPASAEISPAAQSALRTAIDR